MSWSGKFKGFAGAAGRSSHSGSSWLLAIVTLAMAAMLAVLAVPRIVAALYALPAASVIDTLNQPEKTPPDAAQLDTARRGLQLAQQWQKNPRLAVELARVDLVLASRQLAAGLDAKPLLDQTIETVRAGLHLAPADARGWLILCEAILARDGEAAPHLVDYFAESLKASPYELGLSPNRAWLAMVLWNDLKDTALRDAAALQMLMVVQRWRVDALARLAKQFGDPNPAREALSGDRALRERFEATYLQL